MDALKLPAIFYPIKYYPHVHGHSKDSSDFAERLLDFSSFLLKGRQGGSIKLMGDVQLNDRDCMMGIDVEGQLHIMDI